jgi:hypothetical protein
MLSANQKQQLVYKNELQMLLALDGLIPDILNRGNKLHNKK